MCGTCCSGSIALGMSKFIKFNTIEKVQLRILIQNFYQIKNNINSNMLSLSGYYASIISRNTELLPKLRVATHL